MRSTATQRRAHATSRWFPNPSVSPIRLLRIGLTRKQVPRPFPRTRQLGHPQISRDAIGEHGSTTELSPVEAAEHGCLGTLKSLHRRGRVTFRKYLCEHAAAGGQVEVLQWLRDNGCPWVEATCMVFAAKNGREAVVRALIKSGADVNTAWFKGLMPLHAAAGLGHEVITGLLIKAGADINKVTADGGTARNMAGQDGYEVITRLLIEAGADVNKTTDCRRTPLTSASSAGHETVVRVLIEFGADVNKAADECVTPLFIAAFQGQEAVVQALIEAGADMNKTENHGATPLYVASQMGHFEIVKIMQDAQMAGI